MKINLIFIVCLCAGTILFDDINDSLNIVPPLNNSDWNDMYITFVGSVVGVIVGVSLNYILNFFKKRKD